MIDLDMTTEEIFEELLEIGIPTDRDRFLEDMDRHEDVDDIFRLWTEELRGIADPVEEDFLMMAIIVLWRRLGGDRPSLPRFNDLIEKGVELEQAEDIEGAGKAWLEAWEVFKKIKPPGITHFNELDDRYGGIYSFQECLYELEMHLGNLGMENPEYLRTRIEFCQDFAQVFPDHGEEMVRHMRKCTAESCFMLGDTKRGESEFKDLIELQPDYAWGYIGWGDQYCRPWGPPAVKEDYAVAERIYLMALENPDLKDRESVEERLADLYEEMGNKEMAAEFRARYEGKDARSSQPHTDMVDGNGEPGRTAIKVGRNEPCPCGSGKKYKKCCGQGR